MHVANKSVWNDGLHLMCKSILSKGWTAKVNAANKGLLNDETIEQWMYTNVWIFFFLQGEQLKGTQPTNVLEMMKQWKDELRLEEEGNNNNNVESAINGEEIEKIEVKESAPAIDKNQSAQNGSLNKAKVSRTWTVCL